MEVQLHCHSSCNVHLDKRGKKIKSRAYNLSWMQNFISENLAVDLYKSFIEPHFLYADIVHDVTSLSSRHQLQVNQNNALGMQMWPANILLYTSVHHDLTALLDVIRKER